MVVKFPAHEAIYKDTSDNIRFSKLQQWRVTNYALLYAAVWLLSDEPPLNTCAGKAGITLIVTILWAFNIFVLFNTQSSIARFRDRIDWFYKTYFTPSERLELTMVPQDLLVRSYYLYRAFGCHVGRRSRNARGGLGETNLNGPPLQTPLGR